MLGGRFDWRDSIKMTCKGTENNEVVKELIGSERLWEVINDYLIELSGVLSWEC